MLRSSRTLVSLFRALMLAAPTMGTLWSSQRPSCGCKDEGSARLVGRRTPKTRHGESNAVKRLEQFFDDTFTRTNKDLSSPDMKALADKVVRAPFEDVHGQLRRSGRQDPRDGDQKLVAAFRDPRGEAALKKAFDQFLEDGQGRRRRGSGPRGQQAKMKKLPGFAAAVRDGPSVRQELRRRPRRKARSSIGTSTKRCSRARAPRGAASLKGKLQDDITPLPGDGKSPDAVDNYRNELFLANDVGPAPR